MAATALLINESDIGSGICGVSHFLHVEIRHLDEREAAA